MLTNNLRCKNCQNFEEFLPTDFNVEYSSKILEFYCNKCRKDGFKLLYTEDIKVCNICNMDSHKKLLAYDVTGEPVECHKCKQYFHLHCVKCEKLPFCCQDCINLPNKPILRTEKSEYIDVNKHNFNDILKIIPFEIRDCLYISIDCEFSGMETCPEHRISYLDDMEIRYEKTKVSCKYFEILQVGISFFFLGKVDNSVFSKVYNFNLFKDFRNSTCHLFQNSSLKFLRGFDLDLNDIIDNGITYLNENEEVDTRVYLQTQKKNKIPFTQYNELNKKFVQQKRKEIKKWYDYDTDLETFRIYPANSFSMKLLFDNFEDEYDGKVKFQIKRDQNHRRYLELSRSNVSQLMKNENEIKQKIGFSKIIRLLKNVNKPIIFHNGILDATHIFQKFIRELPDTVDEFKQQFTEFFPLIFDTKYISIVHPILNQFFNRKTSLEELFNVIEDWDINIQPLNVDETNLHNAGYDSYITGLIFLALSERLEEEIDFKDFTHFDNYKNIINLLKVGSRVGFDFSKKNQRLGRKDNNNVFLITGITSRLVKDSITQPFKKYGEVKLNWISDSIATVQVFRAKDSLMLDLQSCIDEMTQVKLRKFNIIHYPEARRTGIIKSMIYSQFQSNERKRKIEEKKEIPNNPKRRKMCIIS